eukprot:4970523-Amphidinium_carterae.1
MTLSQVMPCTRPLACLGRLGTLSPISHNKQLGKLLPLHAMRPPHVVEADALASQLSAEDFEAEQASWPIREAISSFQLAATNMDSS